MSDARVAVGTPAYAKAVPGAYGSVVLGRIRDDVKIVLGGVIEKALRDALIKHVGIDLASPDDEVRDGDRVLLPGGQVEQLPDADHIVGGLADLTEVLGVGDSDADTLAQVIEKAATLRVRLGGVMQSLTGDGCGDFADGVRDLERWLKNGKVIQLVRTILGPPDEGLSLSEEVDLALNERPYKDLVQDRVNLHKMLIDFTGRDPGTDLSTPEILRLVLEDYARECERRQAVQDRVQALLLRLAGECGEGLSTETMLDRIEVSLGPVPEF